MGRPAYGEAYECYKLARKTYRKVCRRAVNDKSRVLHKILNELCHTKRQGAFWNLIRKTKSQPINSEAITTEQLQDYFQRKFTAPDEESSFIQQAKDTVNKKYDKLCAPGLYNGVISENKIISLIKQLCMGCSPGIDGIKTEHLRYGIGTSLPLQLSIMLSVCLRFGCVPDTFTTGLLVPLLKKHHLDPCISANYRPITISVILSKLLELYVLEECSGHNMDLNQYGFVRHRGTNTAITLSHDVSAYCLSRGSTIYMCSLDAEGAFDCIPHSVLFLKAIDVLPDHCWRIMYRWYTNMTVVIKWNNTLSAPIDVRRGTRQGGLSSPFLFNLFYQELIHLLNSEICCITIEGSNFNVFCYADDILLASTTPTGLQSLIDISVAYINKHGLRFNPSKTTCLVYGKHTFTTAPQWEIEGTNLAIEDGITYLGARLSSDGGASHTERRIQAAQKAFYMLQGAGLHFKGVDPDVAIKIYTTGVRTVLIYGCESVHICKSKLKELEKTQGKLVKSVLGLTKHSHNTPILQALNVDSISKTIGVSSLNLLRSCLLYSSNATRFYSRLLYCDHKYSEKTLVGRARDFARVHDIDVLRYILDTQYKNVTTRDLKKGIAHGCDGTIDSIRMLLDNYFVDGARDIVQLLVASF